MEIEDLLKYIIKENAKFLSLLTLAFIVVLNFYYDKKAPKIKAELKTMMRKLIR